jgi:biotin carboxyl carrier protein
MKTLKSPLGGTVAELLVAPGQTVPADAVLLVVQSMKMFYEIREIGRAHV